MFKKNGGFTLVELIVVIAILAILAGVAVPAYSAYITNANESADNADLAAVKTAISSAMSFKGKAMADVDDYFCAKVENGTLTIDKVTAVGENPAVPQATIDEVFTQYTNFGGVTSVDLRAYTTLDQVQTELGITFGAYPAANPNP